MSIYNIVVGGVGSSLLLKAALDSNSQMSLITMGIVMVLFILGEIAHIYSEDKNLKKAKEILNKDGKSLEANRKGDSKKDWKYEAAVIAGMVGELAAIVFFAYASVMFIAVSIMAGNVIWLLASLLFCVGNLAVFLLLLKGSYRALKRVRKQ
jgi:hypothetical protein